ERLMVRRGSMKSLFIRYPRSHNAPWSLCGLFGVCESVMVVFLTRRVGSSQKLSPHREPLQYGVLPLMFGAFLDFEMSRQLLDGPKNPVIDIVDPLQVRVIMRIVENQCRNPFLNRNRPTAVLNAIDIPIAFSFSLHQLAHDW